jgi:predicted hydrocarbon binding protein
VFHRALARNPILRHRSVWELIDELASPPPLPSVPETQEVAEAWEPPAPAAPLQGLPDQTGPADLWTPPGPEVVVPAELVPEEPPPALVALPNLDLSSLAEEQHNVLDSYLATCVRAGREVTGRYWSDILAHAGLREYVVHDPVEQRKYVPELLTLSLITEGFDNVLGEDAPRFLQDWGGLVNQHWLQSIQQKPPWMAGPPTGRLVDMLSVFIEALNRVRGEEFHAWKQVGMRLFRVVHECNMTAVGRRREAEACHFWIGAYDAALEWAGLGRNWSVSEVECGCVTGTYNCVFTIVRTDR